MQVNFRVWEAYKVVLKSTLILSKSLALLNQAVKDAFIKLGP